MRSSAFIFTPQALILLCMSASPSSQTEQPRMWVWVCVCACVRRGPSENKVTPKGSHSSPFPPPLSPPPPYFMPAGISLFRSGEMSDLFHHPSHRRRTGSGTSPMRLIPRPLQVKGELGPQLLPSNILPFVYLNFSWSDIWPTIVNDCEPLSSSRTPNKGLDAHWRGVSRLE